MHRFHDNADLDVTAVELDDSFVLAVLGQPGAREARHIADTLSKSKKRMYALSFEKKGRTADRLQAYLIQAQ